MLFSVLQRGSMRGVSGCGGRDGGKVGARAWDRVVSSLWANQRGVQMALPKNEADVAPQREDH